MYSIKNKTYKYFSLKNPAKTLLITYKAVIYKKLYRLVMYCILT